MSGNIIVGKIVHLATGHSSADARIFQKECKTLAKAGFEVVYILPHHQDEWIDGVQLRAVSKPKNRLERMICTVWHVGRIALQENAEYYHLHEPELIVLGLFIKLWGRTVIYDSHEDLPRQILGKYWLPEKMRKYVGWLAEKVEAIAVLSFNRVVAATPVIAARFPASKTITVCNYPLVDELIDYNAAPYKARKNIVVYIGGIEIVRGAKEMVKAMSFLPPSLDAKLVLAGVFDPPKLLTDLEQIPGWEFVDFVGWLSRDQIRDLLARARVGLVTLHPLVNYLDSYPIKLFEYMSAQVPVVASDFPLWQQIIKSAGCGVLVDPKAPQSIASGIEWLLTHPNDAQIMGERGREAVEVYYNWELEANKLIQCYHVLENYRSGLDV